MNSDIFATLRRGCFSEAKQLLNGLSNLGSEESVVSLEVSYYLGDLQSTLTRGVTLQRAIKTRSLKHGFLGFSVRHMGSGDLERAIALSREAHQCFGDP